MNSAIDYQLAWRWLLPIVPGDSVTLLGLPVGADAFLHRSSGSLGASARPQDGCRALVADLDVASLAGVDLQAFDHVCVVGGRKQVGAVACRLASHWPSVRQYGLIPWQSPRLAIPLGSPRDIFHALKMHRPGRLFARAAVELMRVLALLGVRRPLTKRLLLVASRDSAFTALGARLAESTAPQPLAGRDFAVYFGVAGDARKTVAMPTGAGGGFLLKTAWSEAAKALLRHEAAVLRLLSASVVAPHIPRVIGFGETASQVTLQQEYRSRRHVGRSRLRSAVADFLNRLATVDACDMRLEEWLKGLTINIATRAQQSLVDKLALRAGAGAVIRLCREHGDFAPWNLIWTESGVFVFDWEMSRPRAPVLFDAFYYIAAPDIHVGRSFVPARTISKMRGFARRLVEGAEADIDLTMALWLLERSAETRNDRVDSLLEYVAETWQ